MRFDNMHQRTKEGPLEGDTGWVERSVALDIPEGAGSIHYGIMLNGGGNLWARNVTMQEIEPTGATAGNGTLPRRPTNLGFGEAA